MKEEEIITKEINSASGNGNGLQHVALTNSNEGLWWEILLMLRIMKKNLMLTIFIFLVSSTAAFWNFEFCSSFSATARFSVSDWKKWYPTAEGQPVNDASANETLMLFYSDEIINDVIKKFNLSDQVTNAIDSSRLQEKIRNKISIDVSTFNTYYLKVKWPDRYQCAAVTNYLVERVNELSLQLIQEDINTRMAVMQQVFATAGADSSDKITQQFNVIVDELHKLSTPVSKGELEEIKRLQSQYELLAKYFSDRMVMVQLNGWVMKELSSHPFHSVQSLQKATPDFSNYLIAFIFYSIVIGIVCCSLIPFAIYVQHKLNGKNTEELMQN